MIVLCFFKFDKIGVFGFGFFECKFKFVFYFVVSILYYVWGIFVCCNEF